MRLRRIFLEALVVATAGCGGRLAESEPVNADTGSKPIVTANDSATFDTSVSVDADEPEAIAIEEDTSVPVEDTSPAWDTPADTADAAFDSAGFDASVCDGGPLWIPLGSTTGAYGCGSSFTSTERWPCGLPANGFVSAYGAEPANAICADVCARTVAGGDAGDSGYSSCYYGTGSCVFDEVARTVACTKTCSCGGGRRPAQYRDRTHRGPALASFFATMADLETVSVDAFHILRSELAEHGAPKSLLRRCSKSARDEVRHARAMRRLARRFGAASREAPMVTRGPTRSLEEIARENLIEGCVRETWGAALAVVQAQKAGDPSIRGAMRKIAADETRHAELSWEISKFLDRKLDRTARARLRSRRDEVVRELRNEIAGGFDASLVAHAGLPTREDAIALFDALASRIWS